MKLTLPTPTAGTQHRDGRHTTLLDVTDRLLQEIDQCADGYHDDGNHPQTTTTRATESPARTAT